MSASSFRTAAPAESLRRQMLFSFPAPFVKKLNGGRLWHITWTQGTDSTFVFYDADGRPLSICAGRSYIAMVSSVTGQELTVLDSAEQNALN